jgi:hypothetical protein
MAQHMPSMCKALGLSPSNTKTEKQSKNITATFMRNLLCAGHILSPLYVLLHLASQQPYKVLLTQLHAKKLQLRLLVTCLCHTV